MGFGSNGVGGGHPDRIASADGTVNPSQPVAIPGRLFRHPHPQRPRHPDREATAGGSRRRLSGNSHFCGPLAFSGWGAELT